MLRKPRVDARPKRTFAPTSQRPTKTSAGRWAAPGRRDAPRASCPDREHRRRPARGGDGPRHALLGGAIEEDEVEPEAERGHQREPHSRGAAAAAVGRLARGQRDARERERDPHHLQDARTLAGGDAHGERNRGRQRRDRGDDPHRAHGHAAISGESRGSRRRPPRGRRQRRPARERVTRRGEPHEHRREAPRTATARAP